ncbi:hypothetical protein [Vagococcus bubulae]|uniref:hypothetical protein n=1 Tax=Vagococcus bubulae TaxID=1977868 RepID=UPI0022E80A2D|nr:hypothetical protein [Vagococcus bubulae]
MSEKELLKSEKIRIKNDKLRAEGKDPLKGWGKMVDTGFSGGGSGVTGGLNGGSINIDNMGATVEEQKNKR